MESGFRQVGCGLLGEDGMPAVAGGEQDASRVATWVITAQTSHNNASSPRSRIRIWPETNRYPIKMH